MVCLMLADATTYAQPVFSPRAIGLAAYDASVNDTRGFAANPSGLVGMKDWDVNIATYAPAAAGVSGGFVFGGFGVGKRFFDDHALAVQYTPGALLEFVFPSTLRIGGVDIAAERKVSYAEPVAAGYAYRFSPQFSAGLQGRLRTETVSNPRYQFQDTAIVSASDDVSTSTWFMDLGLTWHPSEALSVSAVGRGIANAKSGTLPSEFQNFDLPRNGSLELGAAWILSPAFRLCANGGTDKYGAVGCEWKPGLHVALQGGMYVSSLETPSAYAFSVGAGWSLGFLGVEAAFLHFTNQDNRKGLAQAADLDASAIRNPGMNPFTSDRVSLSVNAVFGKVRETLVRIVGVNIVDAIYPSAYQTLAYRPLGKVRVRNISGQTVQTRASFYVDRLMDVPTESPAVSIAPGEEADIPLTAVFNESVRKFSTMAIREANVYVTAAPADEYDDRSQAKVVIHGKNDWDGDVFSLRFFVTPDDPEIIRYSRDILLRDKDSLNGVQPELEPFQKARVLFNGFAGKLLYVSDPKQSADYVQYPSETLGIRGGDCDDMTVCFASLLSSIGISTAFVDVVPPGKPEDGHIYLLFDTGVSPRYAERIAKNPKRYVIRKGKNGAETLWIPVETTVITRGFDEAWSTGAKEYFDQVEIDLGLAKGWVRVVDVY